MTYQQTLKRGEIFLREHGIEEVKTDSWLLFAMACRIDRNFYYLHMQKEAPKERIEAYEAALKKRAEHVPLQYITGEQEFMGLPFLVNSDVLIPRQDTEILVEEALKKAKPGMRVLDLCTGSGCIIVSMLKIKHGLSGMASDLSEAALCVAKKNAKRNGVSPDFVQGDLFEPVHGTFDLIVSNPPYIPTAEIDGLMPEVKDHEPRMALDGDADGLYFYKRIMEEGYPYLKPGGFLMFEIGYDQGAEVSARMRQAGYQEVKTVKDLAGLDRAVIGGKHV